MAGVRNVGKISRGILAKVLEVLGGVGRFIPGSCTMSEGIGPSTS